MDENHSEYRDLALACLLSNKDLYRGFFCAQTDNAKDFEAYLDKMSNKGSYGDPMELTVTAAVIMMIVLLIVMAIIDFHHKIRA